MNCRLNSAYNTYTIACVSKGLTRELTSDVEPKGMNAKLEKLKCATSVMMALNCFCVVQVGFAADGASVVKSEPPKIAALESKVSQDPKNVTLHYLLANEYVTQNNFGKAILEYHICVELQPKSPAGKYAAEALVRLRKYDNGGPRLDESRAAANRIPGNTVAGAGIGAGTGRVSFTSNSSSAQQITSPAPAAVVPSQNAPKIVSLDYLSSPPGEQLTITGTGFGVPRNELTVTIQGQLAAVVSASSTTIVCIIPEIDMPTWNAPVVVRTTYGVSNAGALNIQTRRIPAL
jgi:hypothetical protein